MSRSIDEKIPLLLLAAYLIEFAVLAVNPVDRTTWIAENLTALIPLSGLVFLYFRGIRFSGTACCCMALFFFLHTVGGHYTFEQVPFDWISGMIGAERNHFDRVCHFLVGAFAFPALEYFDRENLIRSRKWEAFLVILCVFGFAAIFELVEWIYAACADPAAGDAFLGSQGDVWDAQKDMLSDGLGAMTFTAFYALLRWRSGGKGSHRESSGK